MGDAPTGGQRWPGTPFRPHVAQHEQVYPKSALLLVIASWLTVRWWFSSRRHFCASQPKGFSLNWVKKIYIMGRIGRKWGGSV